MPLWQNDDALFDLAKQELFTSVVGDVMDKLKLLHQFLPPQIRPLDSGYVVIGRAMPVLSGDGEGACFSKQNDGEAIRPDAGSAERLEAE